MQQNMFPVNYHMYLVAVCKPQNINSRILQSSIRGLDSWTISARSSGEQLCVMCKNLYSAIKLQFSG